MSTKSSIRYEHTDESGIGFHLYEEMFEEENVYLELEGFDFEASSTSLADDKKYQRLVVRFPIEWAKKTGPAGRSLFKMNGVENLLEGELFESFKFFSGRRASSLSPNF